MPLTPTDLPEGDTAEDVAAAFTPGWVEWRDAGCETLEEFRLWKRHAATVLQPSMFDTGAAPSLDRFRTVLRIPNPWRLAALHANPREGLHTVEDVSVVDWLAMMVAPSVREMFRDLRTTGDANALGQTAFTAWVYSVAIEYLPRHSVCHVARRIERPAAGLGYKLAGVGVTAEATRLAEAGWWPILDGQPLPSGCVQHPDRTVWRDGEEVSWWRAIPTAPYARFVDVCPNLWAAIAAIRRHDVLTSALEAAGFDPAHAYQARGTVPTGTW